MLRIRELEDNKRLIIKKEVSQTIVDCTLFSDKDYDYNGINVVTFFKYSFSGSPFVAKKEIEVGMEDYKTVIGTSVAVSNVHEDERYGLLCDVHVSELFVINRVPVKFVDMLLLPNLCSCDKSELDFLSADLADFYVMVCGTPAKIIGSSNFKVLNKKRLDVSYRNRCFSFNAKDFIEFTESMIMENNLEIRTLTDRLCLYTIRDKYWHVYDSNGYCYTSLTHEDFEEITYREILDLRRHANAYKTVSKTKGTTLDCRTRDIIRMMTCSGGNWCISRNRITNAEYTYLSRFLPKSVFSDAKCNEINDYLALAI